MRLQRRDFSMAPACAGVAVLPLMVRIKAVALHPLPIHQNLCRNGADTS